ncbi:MAG: VanW family protein [Patescibacteria group bacterium]|nr:VanW family protein [Patescibacteria group bacterium]MDD5490876.1 VanW family protein [Patescibacteria group bacterium]
MNCCKAMIKSEFLSNKLLKRWLGFLAAFFLIIVFIGGTVFVYNHAYAEEFFPRICVGNYDLSGKTKEEAEEILKSRAELISNQQLIFKIEGQTFSVSLKELSPETPLIKFNISETIERAYNIGHNKDLLTDIPEQLNALIIGQNFKVDFVLEEKLLLEKIKEKLSPLEKPTQNSNFIAEKGVVIGVTEAQAGKILNYDGIIEIIKENVENFSTIPAIEMVCVEALPQIIPTEAEKYLTSANELLALAPLKISLENKQWPVDKITLADWLMLKTGLNGEMIIGLNFPKATAFLKTIAEEINRPSADAIFIYEDNQVKKFVPGVDGAELDYQNTLSKIEGEFIKNKNTEITAVIKTTPPKITLEEINPFGIKELVGYGESDFKGSPKNRVHNIYNGAAKLQGVLIAPNEEFSLVKTLGEVEASTGYLPELVIKGDRTIPEYGGGLCQIGTTTFRVALGAGLPITERKNHSYRVSYYEPAGLDATIYNPKPDMKFINDTGNYLIFNTLIEDTKVRFELWGQPDGRTHNYTTPVISKITSPGPTKYIETEELKPGEEKCVERAHNGADTYFDYTVIYPDGRTVKERFASHYVAWPKVCLIGKESAVETDTAETNTETTPTTTETTPAQ